MKRTLVVLIALLIGAGVSLDAFVITKCPAAIAIWRGEMVASIIILIVAALYFFTPWGQKFFEKR